MFENKHVQRRVNASSGQTKLQNLGPPGEARAGTCLVALPGAQRRTLPGASPLLSSPPKLFCIFRVGHMKQNLRNLCSVYPQMRAKTQHSQLQQGGFFSGTSAVLKGLLLGGPKLSPIQQLNQSKGASLQPRLNLVFQPSALIVYLFDGVP